MKPELKRDSPRVALVMLSAVGDAVHVLPVANALRRAVPRMKLTWVVQPLAHELVYNHPAIDEFIVFRRRKGLAAVGELARTRRELRAHQFDLLIDLQVYLKAGLITSFARAPVKLGFDRARARDLNWLFTTHRIPAQESQHVQDQYFEFLDYLGVKRDVVRWGIVLTEEECAEQRRFFERLDKPVCAVVVGSSNPRKDWPPDRYGRLLNIIEGDFGFQAVIVGGPAPGERAAAEKISHETSARPLTELGDNLRRLIYLVDGADLLVSPDTGPLHIARALETPVIGLYGYTNPKRSGPYRKYTDLVVDGYARHPGEDYPISMEYRKDGMGRITVEMVVEKFALALTNYVSPNRLQSR